MKDSNQNEKKEIIWFTVIVLCLSSMICFMAQQLGNNNISILSVFTPSIVALILTLRSKGKAGLYELFVGQTIRKAAPKWLLISLIGIPFLVCIAVLTSVNFDFSSVQLRTTQLMPQMLVIVLIALGEEYGWRAFLLPKLMNRFSVFHSSIILGFVWGIWHFPAYLIGTGVPQEMNFLVFLLWVVLGTLFISWMYYYTRSVLTSILAHIGANAAFNYLSVLPEFTENMTVFWVFLAYLSGLMFYVYYRNRKELLLRDEAIQ